MPTYTLTTPAGRLTPEQKARVATGITRTHTEVTGASNFFAQVIINEVPAGNYFLGGRPLAGEQLFLHGQIRGGRSAVDRKRLLVALRDLVAEAAGADRRGVWVYLVDLPACDMIEYGHVLPEPGEEASWMERLSEADRAYMRQTEGAGAPPAQ